MLNFRSLLDSLANSAVVADSRQLGNRLHLRSSFKIRVEQWGNALIFPSKHNKDRQVHYRLLRIIGVATRLNDVCDCLRLHRRINSRLLQYEQPQPARNPCIANSVADIVVSMSRNLLMNMLARGNACLSKHHTVTHSQMRGFYYQKVVGKGYEVNKFEEEMCK